MGWSKSSILIMLTIAFGACSVTRVVKPLKPGEKEISGSFGGPSFVFNGAPIVFPLASVAYAQGLDSTVTAFGAVHITDAMFGVAHAEGGMAINAYQNKSQTFGVMVTPSFHVMTDIPAFNTRTYPQLDALCWGAYGDRQNLVYGGLGTWIELNKARAHSQIQRNEVLPWFSAGHQFSGSRWSYLLEARYIGFHLRNDKVVVDYVSPGSRGALGFYFGVKRTLARR